MARFSLDLLFFLPDGALKAWLVGLPEGFYHFRSIQHIVCCCCLVGCVSIVLKAHSILRLADKQRLEDKPTNFVILVAAACCIRCACWLLCEIIGDRYDGQKRSAREAIQAEELATATAALEAVAEATRMVQNAQESNISLHVKAFQMNLRDGLHFFIRLQKRLEKVNKEEVEDLEEMLAPMKGICKSWIHTFKEVSFDPINFPYIIIPEDEIDRCQNLMDIVLLCVHRLRWVDNIPTVDCWVTSELDRIRAQSATGFFKEKPAIVPKIYSLTHFMFLCCTVAFSFLAFKHQFRQWTLAAVCFAFVFLRFNRLDLNWCKDFYLDQIKEEKNTWNREHEFIRQTIIASWTSCNEKWTKQVSPSLDLHTHIQKTIGNAIDQTGDLKGFSILLDTVKNLLEELHHSLTTSFDLNSLVDDCDKVPHESLLLFIEEELQTRLNDTPQVLGQLDSFIQSLEPVQAVDSDSSQGSTSPMPSAKGGSVWMYIMIVFVGLVTLVLIHVLGVVFHCSIETPGACENVPLEFWNSVKAAFWSAMGLEGAVEEFVEIGNLCDPGTNRNSSVVTWCDQLKDIGRNASDFVQDTVATLWYQIKEISPCTLRSSAQNTSA